MTHNEIRTEIASIERELDSLTFDIDNSYNDDGGAIIDLIIDLEDKLRELYNNLEGCNHEEG